MHAVGGVTVTFISGSDTIHTRTQANNNNNSNGNTMLYNYQRDKKGSSEPIHNQGHLLDLVFSKQSDNILTSTKLHHGLTSDHTAILCKLDVSVPVQKPEAFFVPMPQKDRHRRL